MAWIRRISSADSTNEAESTTIATSDPNTPATTPPRAPPTASIVPHSDPESAFATERSRSSTRFGIAAIEAGSNAAANTAVAASRT